MPENDQPKSKLSNFLSNHPLVSVITTTVIGFIIAAWFFYLGRENRDLVYAVNPVRTLLVRTESMPSDLSISFKGKPIKHANVIAAQIALWNEGKLSVKSTHILKPIEIRLTPPSPILEASIRKVSRDVTKFEFVNDSELLAKGRIQISWEIFEKNDGASMQITYTGDPKVSISVLGIIEGQGAPRRLRAVVQLSQREAVQNERQLRKRKKRKWAVWVSMFILVLILVLGAFGKGPIVRGSTEDKWVSRVLAGALLLATIATGFELYWSRPWPIPPFGY